MTPSEAADLFIRMALQSGVDESWLDREAIEEHFRSIFER